MPNYRKIWQNYYQLTIPQGWHVHHVDEDRDNNEPDNLICVSPYVHWCIHFLQGHPFARSDGFITLKTEKRSAAGSKGARIANIRMFAAGKHPSQRGVSGFCRMSTRQRRENGKKAAKHPNNAFVSGVAGRASAVSPNAVFRKGAAGLQVMTKDQRAEAGRLSTQKVYTCTGCGRIGRGNSMKYHVDNRICMRAGQRFYGTEAA